MPLPRPHRPPSRHRDVVIAVAVTWFVVGASTFLAQREPPERPLDWFAYVLLVVSGAALMARRRFPVWVMAITCGCTVAFGAMGYASSGPFVVPLVIALFTAVSLGRRVPAMVVTAAFLAAFLIGGALSGGRDREALPFVSGWMVAVLVAGEVSRSRTDYFAEEMRRRATEERLRIAREVHDVLSHSISMINVQAGVAVHLLDSRPEQARTALVAIKQASKDALRDLRATLGVLRDVDGDGDHDPARGMGRIDELVSGAQAAGVHLEVTTHGDPSPLPAGVDLAAYRIVQQSVSNIVRHAGDTTGSIDLGFGDGELTIVVANAPGLRDGDSTPGAGDGIRGMRERAEALGGELTAGPTPDGGFRVQARLPVGDRPALQRGMAGEREHAGGRGMTGAGERRCVDGQGSDE